MMSSGGVASAQCCCRAAGDAAAVGAGGRRPRRAVGRARSRAADRLITFDMGGTSADIGIVTETGIAEASARDTWIGGYPLLVPMLDVHTIGAGGGSIAYVDEGGAFRVGPRSAGAKPGPACYGLGGEEPTITDAHVVLGRLDPDHFLGGRMRLDRAAAAEALQQLADAARPWRSKRRRKGSSRSPTRTWRARSARARSRRATIRASSRSSRSAAPGRCTPPSSRTRSASLR